LTFDFNFWNPNRSELPILLVFEEAHNYLSVSAEGSVAARKTVERIAKEGRKYGVSCMIVSQRPAEISETILAQCSNFILLRLLNPNDQAYVRRLVPESFSGLDSTIALLRQGEAIIIGDSIPMPQRVHIDMPDPTPMSSDVLFYDKWKKSDKKTDPHEVLERWWNQQKN
jgi:DNA helicase HerA-like ATPase